ncbi:hypothetical protein SSCG_03609 [Streptomyces clavuligerus]|nr:hypothetical protein SSCG_03609 [Streptomyces clavuligerus]
MAPCTGDPRPLRTTPEQLLVQLARHVQAGENRTVTAKPFTPG